MREKYIEKVLDLLYEECISHGGDGEALWYSDDYSISKILPILEKYNKQLKFPFEIEVSELTIKWGQNQEWIIITNSKYVYSDCLNIFKFVLKN